MKKFIGWLQIIFCSLFLLILLIIFFPIYDGKEIVNYYQFSFINFLTALFVVFLLIRWWISGYKKIKKEKTIEVLNYEKTLDINLKGKIEYKDYRNLVLSINSQTYIYLIFIEMFVLIYLIFTLNYTDNINQHDNNYLIYIIVISLIIIPFITFIQMKKQYQSNKIFQEKLQYHLTNESIRIYGDTIDSTIKWNHFLKLKETKYFFLFYQNKIIASFVEKKMFSENELVEFQTFLKSLDLVKEE